MANELNVDTIVQKACDELIKKKQTQYKEAARTAMREVRMSIVKKWFDGFHTASMNSATLYYPSSKLIDNKHIKITVNSYVDPHKYNFYQSIQKWRRERKIWKNPLTAVNYVLNLQLEDGIIGLPAMGSKPVPKNRRHLIRTGWLDERNYWHNNNFHQRADGLRTEIENSPEWGQQGDFLKKFYSLINKGVK